jgi:peptidoglycan/LPS O-acetylase OafA/YrhL
VVFGETLGKWAVAGFFVLSGYLITGSRVSRPLGEYLVHRVARIFPGYLVCLVGIVLLPAPIAYLAEHGTLDGYLSTKVAPLHFLWANLGLKIGAWQVAGTPRDVPYPRVWDGSLWTLWPEFCCYLVIGFAFCFAAVRRRRRLALTTAFVVCVALRAGYGTLSGYVTRGGDLRDLIDLLPFFLGGAVIYAWRDRLRYHLPGAIAAGVITGILVRFVPEAGAHLAAPGIAYILLWAGTVLPSPDLVKREDISYGIYIYGFVVQQCLVLAGGAALPMPAFATAAIGLSILPATASWLLIERPAMRRARGLAAYPGLYRRAAARTR